MIDVKTFLILYFVGAYTVVGIVWWLVLQKTSQEPDPREVYGRWLDEQNRVKAERAEFAAIRERINRRRKR